MLWFLLQVTVISLSGVMAPGPMTAAALATGARQRHAGCWLAIGHGIVEFPLMILIAAGASVFLTNRTFQTCVGLIGGVVLLALAALTLAALRRPSAAPAARRVTHPLWTGMLLTGANPYFLIWWATIGLKLATQAIGWGLLAFALFAAAHWLCDLTWLEALSVTSHRGVQMLGRRTLLVVQGICALAMAFFGVWFLWDAAGHLRG